MSLENTLDTDAETYAAHCEAFTEQFASATHDDTFKCLDAFLFGFALFQADVHANRIPGPERRVVFAEL